MIQTSTKQRKENGWGSGVAEWTINRTAFISVVFSWKLQEAYQLAAWYNAQGYTVRVGGPAVTMNPGFFSDVATEGGQVDALLQHHQNATFTTRGCIRKCSFCAVHRIEGRLRELPDSQWIPKSIICDNNLLAASNAHIKHVVDKLLEANIKDIDFNQGLDARLLTEWHAAQLSRLHKARSLKRVRLAWDHIKTEMTFRKAFAMLRKAGIPKRTIAVYVLIGYHDTPEDALYRLSEVRNLGAYTNPMRYQPLDAKKRNGYVGENWTNSELTRYMRYWSSLRLASVIPFNEFR